MALNREQMRNRLAVKPVEVTVESLGETVFVRQLTITHRRDFKQKLEELGDEGFEHELWLVMHGICNEDGSPLFQNGDREWLSENAQGVLLQELGGLVLRENGWREEAVEDEAGN